MAEDTKLNTYVNKSVVFMAGAALDLICSQQGRDYNGKKYRVTPAQYGGRYITDFTLSMCWPARHCVTGRR